MLFSSCCRFYNKSSNYSLNEFLKQTIDKKLSTVLHQGRIQDFFRRGCTRLLLYFDTSKPHSFLFLQNTICIRKPQVISGEGGAHPQHPPPRSAPVHVTLLKFFARGVVANIRRNIRIVKNDRSQTQIQIRPRHTVTRYGLTSCFDVFVNVLDSSHLSSSWLWLICSSIATDVAKF